MSLLRWAGKRQVSWVAGEGQSEVEHTVLGSKIKHEQQALLISIVE